MNRGYNEFAKDNDRGKSQHQNMALGKFWLRCVYLALLFAFCQGIGQNSFAPDGTYQEYAIESVSHDVHTYYWGIAHPGMWGFIIALSILLLAVNAIVPLIAAVLFAFVASEGYRPMRNWLTGASLILLSFIIALAGLLYGVWNTASAGRNPGMF